MHFTALDKCMCLKGQLPEEKGDQRERLEDRMNTYLRSISDDKHGDRRAVLRTDDFKSAKKKFMTNGTQSLI